MGKTKSAQKPFQDAQVKSLSSVKEGAVTKPSQTPKSKSKEMAKQIAVKADKADKKSKKAKKEPTPVSSSESESEDEEVDSESSASSDEEAPAPKAAKTNGVKANGAAKVAAKAEESSDSSESASSDDEEDEPTVPKAAVGKAAVAGANEASDSEGSSEGTSEGSSDEEIAAPSAVDAKKLNGKLAKVAPKEATSDEESGSEGTSSGTSESSSDDESETEAAPAPKKRKAEVESTPVSKKAKTDPGNDDAAKKNLFVGQLSWNVDEDWLTREFESFGELSSVRIVTDRETGRSRGFGYVEFVNADDGVKAQEAMHQTDLDGRTINVDFSKPKPEGNTPRGNDRKQNYGDSVSEKSDTLFVANLSFEATEDVVGEEFGKHGNVLGVRLPTDMDTGAPKGFGYVQFGSLDEAEEAFDKMTGAMILGRPIRLDYSTPRPPRNNDSPGGRGRGRGGFQDRGGRGGGRGRGGFDRGGRGGGRGGFDRGRGGRGGSTNRGGFGDYKGTKKTFE